MKPDCFIGVSHCTSPRSGANTPVTGGRFSAVAIASVFPIDVLLVGILAFIRHYQLQYRQRQLHSIAQSDDQCPCSPLVPVAETKRYLKELPQHYKTHQTPCRRKPGNFSQLPNPAGSRPDLTDCVILGTPLSSSTNSINHAGGYTCAFGGVVIVHVYPLQLKVGKNVG